MKKEEITLVMCVKNESKGLKQAVDSVLDYVGDIVIGVDILSDDDTFKVAREITDNIITFKFDNDFSQMRNSIAAFAKTPWVFILDGHEYLSGDIDLNEITDPEVDGILMRVRLESGTEFLQPRLLKKGVQYVGKIHNSPQIKKSAVMRTGLIIHDRTNSQEPEAIQKREYQRKKMMHEIMEKDLKKNKRDTRAAYHLGMFYHAQNEYQKAEKYYKQFLKYSQDKNDRFLVNLNLGLCLFKRNKLHDSINQLKQGLAESGKMWELNLSLGTVYAAAQKHQEAIDHLTQSFELNEKPQRDFPFVREDHKTWNLIANEYYYLNVFDDAAACWQRASEQTTEPILIQLYLDRSKLMAKIYAETRQ